MQVLGLTVLAWGNSMPDLITDVTMARTGFANMAMTACFAGPMCNMLTGLGLGFLALLRKSDALSTAVHLQALTLIDSMYLIANCAVFVGVGLAWQQRVPRQYALVLLCVYAAYLCMNLGFEWWQS